MGECDYKSGTCKCFDGFAGEKCKQKVCKNNCFNNGECIEGNCICKIDFTGISCEFSKIKF